MNEHSPTSSTPEKSVGPARFRTDYTDSRVVSDIIDQYLDDRSASMPQILAARGLISQAERESLQQRVPETSEVRDRQSAWMAIYRAMLQLSEIHASEVIAEPLWCDEARRDSATVIADPGAGDDGIPETGPSRNAERETKDIGRFRWLREHAEGGLGKVSVAFDTELHREVAFKQIKSAYQDSIQSRLRFLREAEITGSLEHPGIVPVYGLGADENGRPYYAMRFIQGQSLKEAIDSFHRLSPASGRQRTELVRLLRRFVDVCNTVDYAHSRGVIHRDLKPGNIMLGPYGETLVVDWGLGKRMEDSPSFSVSSEHSANTALSGVARSQAPDNYGAGDTEETLLQTPREFQQRGELTVQGQIVGTPGFMSPEQMCGQTANPGPSSDIYSLGVILYCVLTGKTPFGGTVDFELFSRVMNGKFPRPREVRRQVPASLEAICLKAMSLRSSDRYGSAGAMAADIEAWMADEPVTAHQESVSERVVRIARRYRSWTLAGVLSLTLLSVGSVTAAVFINSARQKADRLANVATSLRLAREAETTRMTTPVRSALLALSSADATEQHQEPVLPQSIAAIYNSVTSLDGRPCFSLDAFPYLIMAGSDNTVLTLDGNYRLEKWKQEEDTFRRIWNLTDDAVRQSAMDPAKRLFAAVSSIGKVTLWNLMDNPPTPQKLEVNAEYPDFLGFDQQGRWLLICSGEKAVLCHVADGKPGPQREITLQFPPYRTGFAMSADEQFIAIGSLTGTEFFDLSQTPAVSLNFPDSAGPTSLMLTDPACRWMVTQHISGVLRIWDLSRRPVEFREITLNGSDVSPDVAAFSPSGRMMAFGFRSGGLRLIMPEMEDLQASMISLTPHSDLIIDLEFSHNGKQLASASRDGSARIWDLNLGNRNSFREVRGHDGIVHSVEFLPDGSLLTGGGDHVVRRFQRSDESVNPAFRMAYCQPIPWDMQFTASGRLMVSGKGEEVHLLRLTASPQNEVHKRLQVGPHTKSVVSRDGRWLVVTELDRCRSFDLQSDNPEEVVSEWSGTGEEFTSGLEFSPDSRFLVGGCGRETLIWRFREGQVSGAPQHIEFYPMSSRFSPDGKWLAIAPPDSLTLFRFEDGRAIQTFAFPVDVHMVTAVDFSPDSRTIAWAGSDGIIRLWSLQPDAAPQHLRDMSGHLGGVSRLRISPDGKWLASGGNNDSTVRLWNLSSPDTQATAIVLRGRWGQVFGVDFDPEGQWLAAACGDGFVRCWNLDFRTVAADVKNRAGRELTAEETKEYFQP